MSVSLKNNTKLFQILKDISDRKNLCNVTIHCADGIVYNNKLMVGLVLPVLDMVEEFNMQADIGLVMPGETVLEIKRKFEQLLKICKERYSDCKIENDDSSMKDNYDIDNFEDVSMIGEKDEDESGYPTNNEEYIKPSNADVTEISDSDPQCMDLQDVGTYMVVKGKKTPQNTEKENRNPDNISNIVKKERQD